MIYLERGQVFRIEGKTFFAFGGAVSHDIQGSVLDENDPDYWTKKKSADQKNLPYRIKNKSWWAEEGRRNLEKADYQVDYVITHCCSNRIQMMAEILYGEVMRLYKADVLTEYFEQLEEKLQYRHWFCRYYHVNRSIDLKHTIVFEEIIFLKSFEREELAADWKNRII